MDADEYLELGRSCFQLHQDRRILAHIAFSKRSVAAEMAAFFRPKCDANVDSAENRKMCEAYEDFREPGSPSPLQALDARQCAAGDKRRCPAHAETRDELWERIDRLCFTPDNTENYRCYELAKDELTGWKPRSGKPTKLRERLLSWCKGKATRCPATFLEFGDAFRPFAVASCHEGVRAACKALKQPDPILKQCAAGDAFENMRACALLSQDGNWEVVQQACQAGRSMACVCMKLHEHAKPDEIIGLLQDHRGLLCRIYPTEACRVAVADTQPTRRIKSSCQQWANGTSAFGKNAGPGRNDLVSSLGGAGQCGERDKWEEVPVPTWVAPALRSACGKSTRDFDNGKDFKSGTNR